MLSINDRTLISADGTRIAYAVQGDGPAVVLTNGLTTTTTFWKYTRPVWLKHHRVVTWDLPGHGNSGPAQSDASATVQGQASFVAEVMRATGIEQAAQVGWSTGAQVVLELYRQRPELCAKLALVLGGAGPALERAQFPLGGGTIAWLARALPRPVFAGTCRILSSAFQQPSALDVGRWLGLVGPRVSSSDMEQLTAHIASVEPHTLQRMLRAFQSHSARDVFERVRVPVLIVAGDEDPFAPTERVGLPLHDALPGSVLLRLANGTHTALIEEPEVIADAVARFLGTSGVAP